MLSFSAKKKTNGSSYSSSNSSPNTSTSSSPITSSNQFTTTNQQLSQISTNTPRLFNNTTADSSPGFLLNSNSSSANSNNTTATFNDIDQIVDGDQGLAKENANPLSGFDEGMLNWSGQSEEGINNDSGDYRQSLSVSNPAALTSTPTRNGYPKNQKVST